MTTRICLAALLCVLLVAYSVEAYHGPRKPLCPSCGLRNPKIPTRQDELGFTEYLLDRILTSMTPIDLAEDGVWELAVSLDGTDLLGEQSSPKVGILDLRTASWVDGPHDLPVAASNWGAAAVGTSGTLHYYYYLDEAVRDFSPSDQVDSVLLSLDFVPTSVLTWGQDDGQPLIGIRKSGTGNITCQFPHNTWYIFRASTGDLIETVPGASGAIVRLRVSPEAEDELGFMVSAGSVTSPGPFTQWCAWADTYGDGWSSTSRSVLPAVVQTGLGPASLSLRSAVSSWQENGFGVNVWYSIPSGYPYGITSYYLFATGGANWIMPFSGYLGKYTSVASVDINADGTDELLLPFTSPAHSPSVDWEVRSPVDGHVVDTLQDMPSAYIASGPYLRPDRNALFYTKGSSLFMKSQEEVITSVEDPDVPESKAHEPLELSASPNPFNAAVTLSWSWTATSLTIFNVLGQPITKMAIEGKTSMTWDGRDSQSRDCPSGIYIAQVGSRNFTASTKIVLLR